MEMGEQTPRAKVQSFRLHNHEQEFVIDVQLVQAFLSNALNVKMC